MCILNKDYLSLRWYVSQFFDISNPVADECKEMVDRYTTQLVQMIITEYTPGQICAELGLCNKGITMSEDYIGNEILSNDIPSLEDEDYDDSMESSEESSEELNDISMRFGNRMVWLLILSVYHTKWPSKFFILTQISFILW